MPLHDGKVLMIGWEYPPHNSGGLGVACQGLTKSLAGTNTQIYFTLPYILHKPLVHMNVLSCVDPEWELMNSKNKAPFMAYTSVRTRRSSFDRPLDLFELNALPQSELEHKVERYSQLVEQNTNQLKNDFDLIHAHDWMAFPAAARLKKKTGKAMVAHIHSTEFDRIPHGYGSHYIAHTEYEGMMTADRVIAVSYYTKRLLVDKYQINPNKIDVVHNGISFNLKNPSFDKYQFAHKRPVVVFMGRFTAQKGAEFFISVAKKVLEKMSDTLFILAGSGDMYHELLFRAAGKSLSASVLFSGFVRDKQKDKLLNRADVFIMPSVSEPFGLVALEAASYKTPVIISKNSGVAEVMKSAMTIDFWDLDKMSQTVLRLLRSKGFSEKVVKGQLRDLKSLSWDKSAQAVKQVYNRLFS
ncbi:MAG: glycosyltransferase family 4 protein [Candidatus Woesebacteria bacterium]|jgi:glycosyltransferase involved in cell wall biosynthesis